jgi:hypothetical protein
LVVDTLIAAARQQKRAGVISDRSSLELMLKFVCPPVASSFPEIGDGPAELEFERTRRVEAALPPSGHELRSGRRTQDFDERNPRRL